MREHLGGVRDFLEKLKIDTLQELERSAPNAKAATQETPAIQEKPQGNVSFEQMKAKSKEEKETCTTRKKRPPRFPRRPDQRQYA